MVPRGSAPHLKSTALELEEFSRCQRGVSRLHGGAARPASLLDPARVEQRAVVPAGGALAHIRAHSADAHLHTRIGPVLHAIQPALLMRIESPKRLVQSFQRDIARYQREHRDA